MKIEEGGYYRTCNGTIVGPANRSGSHVYPWRVGLDGYTEIGKHNTHGDSLFDLVARVYVSDEPAEPPTAEPDWHEVRVRFVAGALACPTVLTPEGAVRDADAAIKYMKENPL